MRIEFVILGQPYNKSNSRELVKRGEKPMLIKSSEALAWQASALKQIPPSARLRLEGPVKLTAVLTYPSMQPDLDESLLMDILQDQTKSVTLGSVKQRVLLQSGVYRNDRQIWQKDIRRAIDRHHPRAWVCIEDLSSQEMLALDISPKFTPPEVKLPFDPDALPF